MSFKIVQCETCGVGLVVGVRQYKPAYCQNCRMARYIENLISLKTKSGEPYEKCRAAHRKWTEEGRGRGGVENSSQKPGDSI